MTTLIKRIEYLERRAIPAGEVPFIQGLGADGYPLFLNCVTGELVTSLPERGAVTASIDVDLRQL